MQQDKDIKYDIPVCHEGQKGHEGHENFMERVVVLWTPFFNSVYLFDCDISD